MMARKKLDDILINVKKISKNVVKYVKTQQTRNSYKDKYNLKKVKGINHRTLVLTGIYILLCHFD